MWDYLELLKLSSRPVIYCLPQLPSQHALLLPPFPSHLSPPPSVSLKSVTVTGVKAGNIPQTQLLPAPFLIAVQRFTAGRPQRVLHQSHESQNSLLFTENRRTERKAFNPRPNHVLYI